MDITAVLEGGTGGSASQLHNYFLKKEGFFKISVVLVIKHRKIEKD